MNRVGAIIPAAGSGSRLGADLPKQFLFLGGVPILVRTLAILVGHPAITTIVIAVAERYREACEKLLAEHLPAVQTRIIITPGGQTRQESVLQGLAAMPRDIGIILVHDAARPLLSRAIIDRCLAGVNEHGAVIAAVPVKDTLKRVAAGSAIRETVPRARLWQAQTPQVMQRHLFEQAVRQAARDGFQGTDEASLLEHAGIPVHVIMGAADNFKITRQDDLDLAGRLVRRNRGMRIGHGFDVHRLVRGRKLILGGVEIPFELGLQGHSDADVLTHALMDGLLGAMGERDIGQHFPDSDQRFAGISSLLLLERVMERLSGRCLVVVNADLTLICQRPRLADYLAAMEKNLASVCKILENQINIKATTTEGLGFAGRGEGIAAHAVVLLDERDDAD